jgi:hypothetical protein
LTSLWNFCLADLARIPMALSAYNKVAEKAC